MAAARTSPVKALRSIKSAPSLRGQFIHSTPPVPQPSTFLSANRSVAGDCGARNMNELRTELKRRGLKVSGKKQDLVERLCMHDSGARGFYTPSKGVNSGPITSPTVKSELTKRSTPNLRAAFSNTPAPPMPKLDLATVNKSNLTKKSTPNLRSPFSNTPSRKKPTLDAVAFPDGKGPDIVDGKVRLPFLPDSFGSKTPEESHVSRPVEPTLVTMAGAHTHTEPPITMQDSTDNPASSVNPNAWIGSQQGDQITTGPPSFFKELVEDILPSSTLSRPVRFEADRVEEATQQSHSQQEADDKGDNRSVLFGFAGFSAMWLAFGSRFQRKSR